MTHAAVRAHYVRHNQVTRIPRAFIYLDSEAVQREEAHSSVQTFRLACAALDRRYHHRDGWRDREWKDFGDVESLWDWVTSECQPKSRTILVCHNLAYDLRITGALEALVSRSWSLEGIRLDSTQAWCSWKCGTQTLVMVDSLSWVNAPLEKVGTMVGIPKLDLPPWDDTDEAWRARCRRDVEILATMYRRLIDWVRDEDLGNWKPTGAGQSWAAYRHRFMHNRLLVHEDVDAREAERVAGWTGRCEAWRWGKLQGGPFYEWDYSTAYARIGAECEVPVRLGGELTGKSLARVFDHRAGRAVLAHVTVSTDVPTVPCRNGNGIIWPIGTFDTTLWDTEVDLALAHGATVTPHRGWLYYKAPAVADFCTWCLGVLDSPEGDVDPIVRAAVKHWSRALIGRFGSRYSTWEEYGRLPWSDVALGRAVDPDTGETWRALQLGTQLRRQTAEFDSADAVPSVMTWVMAEARVRLYNAALAAGIEHVAYLDTDSLIVGREGHTALSAAALPGFRVKSQWQNVEVLGPRQLILQGQLRAAGVPRGAHRVDEVTWEGEVWSQLSTSIGAGEADSVRITPRRVKLAGRDLRRRRDSDGRTYPLAV